MAREYLRRTVLAATGTVLSGTALASGSGDTTHDDRGRNSQSQNTTVSQRQEVRVTQEQRVEIQREPLSHRPKHRSCAVCTTDDGNKQTLGTLMIYNHSTCQRMVTVETTGMIALEGEQLEDQTLSIQVPPKGSCYAGFTGSMARLEAEDGDLDIDIRQRSESEASHCGGETRVFND